MEFCRVRETGGYGAIVWTYLNWPFVMVRITAGFEALRFGVNRDLAGDALEILRGRERVADFRAVGRAGALHGVRQNHRRIVAERGHGVGRFVVFGLEFFHEILHGVGEVSCGE